MSRKKDKTKTEPEIPVTIIGPDGRPLSGEGKSAATPAAKEKEPPPSPEPAEEGAAETASTEEGAVNVAALRAERDDLLARLQRLAADYQNYQKRIQKEREQERHFAAEGLLKSLLPVLDDMERGLVAAKENHAADDPLLTGMQLVHDKLLRTLEQFGLSEIPAVGMPFDPARHSAMMQEPSEKVSPLTVLRVLQRGYELKGRTLRPAAVVVAQPPAEEKSESPQQQEPETKGES